MALSKEEDTGFTSMLPFGPWFRHSIGLGHGGELVGAWLGWSSYGSVLSMLFGAFLCWKVTFARKGLSNGLSLVGLTSYRVCHVKSVWGAFTCVLEACAVESVGEECYGVVTEPG